MEFHIKAKKVQINSGPSSAKKSLYKELILGGIASLIKALVESLAEYLPL